MQLNQACLSVCVHVFVHVQMCVRGEVSCAANRDDVFVSVCCTVSKKASSLVTVLANMMSVCVELLAETYLL